MRSMHGGLHQRKNSRQRIKELFDADDEGRGRKNRKNVTSRGDDVSVEMTGSGADPEDPEMSADAASGGPGPAAAPVGSSRGARRSGCELQQSQEQRS